MSDTNPKYHDLSVLIVDDDEFQVDFVFRPTQ